MPTPMLSTGLALLLALAAPAFAQAQAPASAAPTYTPTLTFDVASIRESSGLTGNGLRVGVKSPPNSSTFECTNFPAKSLIQIAYGFGTPIANVPDWLNGVYYNVQAKSDSSADEQLAKLPLADERLEKQHMLQVLLVERFHLKYHMEDKESSVFALVPAKGGIKLTPIKLDPNAPAPANQGVDIQTHGGAQGLEFIARTASPTSLAAMLSSQLEAPVIDRSGLTGFFDFTLQMGRDWSANNPQSWPDIFTAVQEQLGLKLERTKAVLPNLIIDHIDKPTPN
jgi:uncharacterized protein (TIGR03435 family)